MLQVLELCVKGWYGAYMKERRAYPLSEASELLGGISRRTLYDMEDRGELRMVRIGRRVFVPASEIERLVAGTPA